MKYGLYLEENTNPEWSEFYVSYKRLKKILKVLAAQLLTKPPAEWNIGVSLSTPAPTNAAAMPSSSQSDDELEAAPLTQNDFFKVLEADMEKVEKFTKLQVKQIRAALKAVDGMMAGYTADASSSTPPLGAKEQVDAVGDRFLKLEKYVNLNFTAFRKILKKHDKNLPNPCSAFYIGRLHQQGWVRGDYSDVIVNISNVYSAIRGDTSKEDSKGAAQNFLRKTTKYWVRPEFVTAIKYVVSQRLPVSLFATVNKNAFESDAQLVNSVYLDNSQLELYHGRLDKTPGAIALRLRWYGTGEPTLVFVERKTHRDSWTGEVSVKERFIIKPSEVPLLLSGKFNLATKKAEMAAKGKSEVEIADWDALATEVIQAINSKQLVPTMRSQYMRTAFQLKNDASVRISLDTNLCMIYERDPGVLLGERWYRDPTKVVPEDQITRFPHAVLEVKLEIEEGMTTPQWVKEVITSGMVTEVFKFSKFIHGCAVLMQDDVQAVPYWVDDASLAPSITASKGHALLQDNDSRVDANRQLPQLLPHGEHATAKRSLQPRVAATELVLGGREHTAEVMQRRKEKEQEQEPQDGLVEGGGGGGGGGGPPQPAVVKAKSPTRKASQKARQESSNYYEQKNADHYQAQDDCLGVNQCLAGTDCWWLSSESPLVADDLPTPSQKLEPKLHFANERTFLHWLHVAVYFTALATGIMAFAPTNSLAESFSFLVMAFACAVTCYAIGTFHKRARKIRLREQVRWDDPLGPTLLGSALVLALTIFFGLQLHDLGVL